MKKKPALFMLGMVLLGLPAPEAAPLTEKTDLSGRVTWPAEYQLEVHRPESQISEAKPYISNVVQNLILDELSLQRLAITRDRITPASIEYSVQRDHNNLPVDERTQLITRQPKPAVLPLKILRLTAATAEPFDCARVKGERYSLLTRISGRVQQLRLEVLLCQGKEVLLNQTTTAEEQELVAGVNRLINPVRAKLTGDQYTSLKIDTYPPRASVYLDGQFLGKTPLRYSYLIPGNYRLTIRHEGFAAHSSPLEAKAGETFTGKFDLIAAKAIGTIDVDSEPAGAKIYLDADYKGVTPKKIENVPVGTYRVHVLHPEKGEIYRSVTISEGNLKVKISEALTEFAFQKTPGFLGFSYKTWYWTTLATSAVFFGTAVGCYIWRDQAKEDIYARLNGKAISQYDQADHDFIADRNAAYSTRETYATTFMVSAGVMAVLSIYFYVQHLLSADEGIVMHEKPKKEDEIEIRLGGFPGHTALSASFRF